VELERLIEWLLAEARARPLLALLFGAALFSQVARALSAVSERRPVRRGAHGDRRPTPAAGDSAGDSADGAAGGSADDPTDRAKELEERIRRNFEEMLRRRAESSDAAPASPVPRAPAESTQRAEAAANPERVSRAEAATTEPKRAPQRLNYDAQATRREEGRSLESRGDAPSRRVPSATRRSHGPHRPASRLRRAVLDRAGLRRAIVMCEVLGRPRALEEPDSQVH
jgi:hypothetical protein